jgi:hypothetical protein
MAVQKQQGKVEEVLRVQGFELEERLAASFCARARELQAEFDAPAAKLRHLPDQYNGILHLERFLKLNRLPEFAHAELSKIAQLDSMFESVVGPVVGDVEVVMSGEDYHQRAIGESAPVPQDWREMIPTEKRGTAFGTGDDGEEYVVSFREE